MSPCATGDLVPVLAPTSSVPRSAASAGGASGCCRCATASVPLCASPKPAHPVPAALLTMHPLLQHQPHSRLARSNTPSHPLRTASHLLVLFMLHCCPSHQSCGCALTPPPQTCCLHLGLHWLQHLQGTPPAAVHMCSRWGHTPYTILMLE